MAVGLITLAICGRARSDFAASAQRTRRELRFAFNSLTNCKCNKALTAFMSGKEDLRGFVLSKILDY